jgi:DNA-binding SARP family transcriptional activator
MLRLRTLGQLDLRDDGGAAVTAVLVQPKRLALLAYLATTATEAFQRRDLLLPVFWPELSEANARNALRQALHQLRRALGDDVLLSRGADMLGINGARLACDACAFEAALARGALDDALAAYGGDFLPGFGIDDSAEFDRWLDDTRAALRLRATHAAWTLAERHERSGDVVGAAAWARRGAALDPDEARGTRQLVALLARVGDPAAALDAYAAHAHRLARDGDAPAPALEALAEECRARVRQHVAPAAPAPAGTRAGAAPVSVAAARERVTIAPFQNLTGDPAADYVGRLVCNAIAQGILASRTVEVVTTERPADATAIEADTGLVVSGAYFLCDDAWRFQARVGEPGGRVLDSIGDVTASRLQPWEAADELRRRVSGVLASRLDPRFASWANAVSQAPDLDAHHELALGAELHLRGDYRGAMPHLLRAAQARGGFTLPALWAIQASCNLGEWEQAEAILAELTDRSRRGRLSTFEQLSCDFYAATLGGQHGEALRIARLAAELVPDSEVLSQLGREAIFCNHPRAAVEALERLHPQRGWIPSWTPHWRRLTEAHHMLGDHARELDAARRGRAHHPDAVSAVLYEARAHAALGDVAALERCVDEACALPPDRFTDAGGVMLDVARELRAHGRAPEGRALASRAVAWHRDRAGEAPRGARPDLALACALYECGRWPEAQAVVRERADGAGEDVDAIGLAGAIAARIGDVPAAREALRALRAKTGRFRFGAQYVWMARVLAVLGEAEAAIAALHGGFARGFRHGIELHADGDLALLAGRPAFRELLRPKG